MAINYTNKGLVEHAKKALSLKTKYMWGGLLREITPAYIAQLKKIYGTKSGTGYTDARYAKLQSLVGKGYYGVDCIGMIKSYYWSGKEYGGTSSPYYNSSTDINAGTMYSRATVKGKIDTMPETPGLIVYSKSHPHVGIYIGDGYTIESTLGSRGDGVVKRKLDSFWEYWFQCSFISYQATNQNEKTCTVKLLYNAVVRDKPSMNGSRVTKLYTNNKVEVIKGTETVDPSSNLVYIKLYNINSERWIVKSATDLK